jgi:hypothetical protein
MPLQRMASGWLMQQSTQSCWLSCAHARPDNTRAPAVAGSTRAATIVQLFLFVLRSAARKPFKLLAVPARLEEASRTSAPFFSQLNIAIHDRRRRRGLFSEIPLISEPEAKPSRGIDCIVKEEAACQPIINF